MCEGVRVCGKNRKERINPRDFVSLDRTVVMKELTDYLGNQYRLNNTVMISNGDGGSGYTKGVFDELCGASARHEFFLDAFHVNKKIKDRLSFAKELQAPLMTAIWREYDPNKVTCILNTAESLLIEELDTSQNQEQLRKLRAYLERNWAHIKPFHLRKLRGISKAIGTCESNHRQYTYRMKGQGKYWSKDGAEFMVRLIASLKNQDLDKWLTTDYHASEPIPEFEKRAREAVRKATSKKWNKTDQHISAQYARVVGSEKTSTGMGKLVKSLIR